MFQIDSADAVLVKPAKAAPGPNVGGHFRKNDGAGTRGTVVTADWENMVNSELANLLATASPAITQDKDDDTQLEDALRAWPEIGGVISSLTDTGVGSTNHLRVAVAGDGRAVGASSFCAADLGSEARGVRTATLATQGARLTANADTAAIVASKAANLGEMDNEGTASFMAAVATTAALTAVIANGAEACAMLACNDAIHAISATAEACSFLACRGGEFLGASKASAIIASGFDTAGTTADRPKISGPDFSAFIGCEGDATLTNKNCVVVGSQFGIVGVTIAEQGLLLFDGITQQIHLDSTNGQVEGLKLRIDDNHALGAGGAATLGLTGGTGPVTPAQAQWVKMNVNGTDHWIAVWT